MITGGFTIPRFGTIKDLPSLWMVPAFKAEFVLRVNRDDLKESRFILPVFSN